MVLVDSVKNLFLQRALKKNIRARRSLGRKIVNYEKAGSIGILFDDSTDGNSVIIGDYQKQLHEQGKVVKVLGYQGKRDKVAAGNMTVFNSKDLNWFNLPESSDVRRFIEYPFDILLSLHVDPIPQLEYVAAMSKAHIRVGSGSSDTKTKFYDIMIDAGKVRELHYLIKQIEHYISVINN